LTSILYMHLIFSQDFTNLEVKFDYYDE
jgi:hypothetical protein